MVTSIELAISAIILVAILAIFAYIITLCTSDGPDDKQQRRKPRNKQKYYQQHNHHHNQSHRYQH